MQQREIQEGNENILSNSDQVNTIETTESKHQNIEGTVPGRSGKSLGQLGQVAARLQAARKALKYPAKNVRNSSESSISTRN